MKKTLIKIANKLDEMGYSALADEVTAVAYRLSQRTMDRTDTELVAPHTLHHERQLREEREHPFISEEDAEGISRIPSRVPIHKPSRIPETFNHRMLDATPQTDELNEFDSQEETEEFLPSTKDPEIQTRMMDFWNSNNPNKGDEGAVEFGVNGEKGKMKWRTIH